MAHVSAAPGGAMAEGVGTISSVMAGGVMQMAPGPARLDGGASSGGAAGLPTYDAQPAAPGHPASGMPGGASAAVPTVESVLAGAIALPPGERVLFFQDLRLHLHREGLLSVRNRAKKQRTAPAPPPPQQPQAAPPAVPTSHGMAGPAETLAEPVNGPGLAHTRPSYFEYGVPGTGGFIMPGAQPVAPPPPGMTAVADAERLLSGGSAGGLSLTDSQPFSQAPGPPTLAGRREGGESAAASAPAEPPQSSQGARAVADAGAGGSGPIPIATDAHHLPPGAGAGQPIPIATSAPMISPGSLPTMSVPPTQLAQT